jgi:hypothetical protein
LKRFGLIDNAILISKIKEKFPQISAKDLELVAELSRGRVGLADQYARDLEAAAELKKKIESFRKALRGGIIPGLELSKQFSDDREDFLYTAEEWIWYLRDFLRKVAISGENIKIVRKVFIILDLLVILKSRIENTNVNQRVQLDNFFVQIN